MKNFGIVQKKIHENISLAQKYHLYNSRKKNIFSIITWYTFQLLFTPQC